VQKNGSKKQMRLVLLPMLGVMVAHSRIQTLLLNSECGLVLSSKFTLLKNFNALKKKKAIDFKITGVFSEP
jgi:hypothetical protein